jgi:hypothetical protein
MSRYVCAVLQVMEEVSVQMHSIVVGFSLMRGLEILPPGSLYPKPDTV